MVDIPFELVAAARLLGRERGSGAEQRKRDQQWWTHG